MLTRLAFHLSFTRAPEQRWRQLALVVASAAGMAAILLVLAIYQAGSVQDRRDDARIAVVADGGEPARLILAERADRWGGQQFPVIWLQSVAGNGVLLPPGVSHLPGPGGAAVSPALADAMNDDPMLAARYSAEVRISPAGLRGPDELIAYVRAPAGVSMERQGTPVARFGARSDTERQIMFSFREDRPGFGVVVGMLSFLVAPAALLGFAGVATASPLRERRAALLRRLGVPIRTIVLIALMETSLMAVPAAVLSALLFAVTIPSASGIPLTPLITFPGDLGVPLASGCCAVLAWTALLTVFAAATALRPVKRGTRTNYAKTRPSAARKAPMIAAALIAPLSVPTGGVQGAQILGIAFLLALAGLPLVAPAIVRAIAGMLAARRSILAVLAARRLVHDPMGATRPMLAFGVLVIVAFGAAGYLAGISGRDPVSPAESMVQRVEVRSASLSAEELTMLRSRIPRAAVFPYIFDSHGMTLGGGCPDAARLVPTVRCGAEQSGQSLAMALGIPGGPVRFTSLRDWGWPENSGLIVLAPRNVSTQSIRTAIGQTLVAATVNAPDDRAAQVRPVVDWIAAGLVSAGVLTALALGITVVDRTLDRDVSRHPLLSLGLTMRQFALLEAGRFGMVFVLVALTATVAGLVVYVCLYLLTGPSVDPLPILGLLFACIALAGGAMTGTIAVLTALVARTFGATDPSSARPA